MAPTTEVQSPAERANQELKDLVVEVDVTTDTISQSLAGLTVKESPRFPDRPLPPHLRIAPHLLEVSERDIQVLQRHPKLGIIPTALLPGLVRMGKGGIVRYA